MTNLNENLLFLQGVTILKQIQEVNPEAFIAGGFLRDLFFGKQPKDLDIFVDVLPERYERSVVVNRFNMSYSTEYEIHNVFDIKFYDAPEWLNVNVIELNSLQGFEGLGRKNSDVIEERVALHDFDFCQVAFDGENFYGLDKLEKVKQTGIVTLVNVENEKQAARSLRRLEKFKEKYKEFTFEISESAKSYLP